MSGLIDKVNENPPAVPVFTWTFAGRTRTHAGFEPFPITLPDGRRLTVQVWPHEAK